MKTSTPKPKKFMSLRDKNGSHRRSKSSEPSHKSSRPLSSDVFFSYFKSDAAKQAARAEEEKEKLANKVDEVAARAAESKLNSSITKEHMRLALTSRYAQGDIDKALELIKLHQQAFSGILLPYNPNTEMVGAENRGNVTCYLDALLFAMYAKLEAFECMLKNDLPDGPPRKLAALVRLWVNMLRSGKLITIDMTEHMQEALAECGWKDARLLEQQDTSEAFAFITETLQLPLLTLQVDLFHQGKRDEDDHKVVYERLLNLAVPSDPEGKGVKLEDCLEDYFNTKVDVLRDSLEDKKAAERSPVSRKPLVSVENTIRAIPREDGAVEMPARTSESFDRDPAPLQRRWSMLDPPTLAPGDTTASSSSDGPRPLVNGRHRSSSIIQRIVIDDAKPVGFEPPTFLQQFKRQGSTVVKAVTIPAWQFFKLIPWHSTSSNNNEPRSDFEVARQFNQRPVVGICLKRYMMTETHQFQRQNTYIDIPDSLRLPYFMMAENGLVGAQPGLSTEYKLVLQSVVCHRGMSLHSGHYVSFARVNPKLLTDNRRHDSDPPPDYEEQQWVKFDDLAVDNRVSYVEDIRAAFKADMPYLLFYQIMPMVDVTPSITEDNDVNEPPSYNDSTGNVGERTPNAADGDRGDIRRLETAVSNGSSSYIDTSTWGGSTTTGPSIRFSSELDRPPRVSFDEDSNGSSSAVGTYRRAGGRVSRRESLVFTESNGGTPSRTPERARSPVLTAAVPPSEETTSQRFSRAAALLTGKSTSRSRPASQAGEGRMSLTMSRLGGLMMRSSKEPLRQSEEQAEAPGSALPAAPLTSSTTAPAATPVGEHGSLPSVETLAAALLAPAPAPPQQGSGQGEDGQQSHHHHHHHHHSLRRGKSKSRSSKEWEVLDTASSVESASKGKEKERDRTKNKTGVPERECAIM